MGLEILYGIGALVLLGALAWGASQYNRRNRAATQAGAEVARERYKNNDA